MVGQFGHFYNYAPKEETDAIKYGVSRYGMETQRLLSVLNAHLDGKQFIVGDLYTIADMAIMPWAAAVFGMKDIDEFMHVNEETYPHIKAWIDRMMEREPVQKGRKVCGW